MSSQKIVVPQDWRQPGTNPPGSKAPDRPDFHRGLGFARRFARKGREIAPVYAGWDDVKVILLGTSPLAEADRGPFMTSGPGSLWGIYGDPPYPRPLPTPPKPRSHPPPPLTL